MSRKNPRPIPLDMAQMEGVTQEIVDRLTEAAQANANLWPKQHIHDSPSMEVLFRRAIFGTNVKGEPFKAQIIVFATTSYTGGVALNDIIPLSTPDFLIRAFIGHEAFDDGRQIPIIGLGINGYWTWGKLLKYLTKRREEAVAGIHSEIIHEMTHLRDVIKDQEKWKKKKWAHRDHEIRAIMQQIIHQVRQKIKRQPHSMTLFNRYDFAHVLRQLSPKYRKVYADLTPEGTYIILSGVHQALVEDGHSFERGKLK